MRPNEIKHHHREHTDRNAHRELLQFALTILISDLAFLLALYAFGMIRFT